MSRERAQVSYDGPALSEHGMDVYTLAPALLAFGDLIREANKQVNGDRSKVTVSVTEDFEHKCFNINFEVFQSVLDQVVGFFGREDVQSAKNILEWLELVAKYGTLPAGGIGLFTYLRLRKGRKIEEVNAVEDSDASGNVAIKFEGDRNHVVVHQTVYQLGENPKIRSAAKRVVEPLERKGFDELSFRENDKPITRIAKDEAKDISLSCAAGPNEEEALEPQRFTAHLTNYAPVFDPGAEKWRFHLGDKVIYADITETTIAQDAVDRGYVTVGDVYKVKLEMTEHRTPTNQYRTEYKILEVLEFHPGGPPDGGQFDMLTPTGGNF